MEQQTANTQTLHSCLMCLRPSERVTAVQRQLQQTHDFHVNDMSSTTVGRRQPLLSTCLWNLTSRWALCGPPVCLHIWDFLTCIAAFSYVIPSLACTGSFMILRQVRVGSGIMYMMYYIVSKEHSFNTFCTCMLPHMTKFHKQNV
jgi:hypothetical protein